MNLKEIYSIISDNVYFYRTNNLKYGYLTQDRLAKLSGIHINLIRSIEEKRKKLVLNINVINSIANALDIPIYKFFIKKVNKM